MTITKVRMVVVLIKLLLLLHFCLGSDHNIIHIKRALSDPCPAQPCLTLSQFASNQEVNSNTTVVILPGKHRLESIISVANTATLVITSTHSDINTEITCDLSGGLAFTNVRSVHISGLDFIQCTGNRVQNVENFTLEESNFLNHEGNITADGAALELYGSSVVILRSSFRSYRGSTQQAHGVRLAYNNNSSTIPNTEKYRIGGAVISVNSSTTIIDSRFERNGANTGGAIMVYRGSLKILDECEFSNNEAYSDGGVIRVYQGAVSISKGNSFTRNVAHDDGGVIHAFESDVIISGENTFDGNTALDGGAVNTYKGSLTILYGNTFSQNMAHKDGGAIFAYQSNTSISDENVFSNNVAENDGGAIHAYQQDLTISDTDFVNNNASDDGGTIWAHEANTRTARNFYVQNYAGNRGGVWNIYKGFLKVFHSNFSLNKAIDGGAIFADMGEITVENTTLEGNEARKGGAIHTYQSDVVIFGANFSQNSAERHGGGWCMREGSATVRDSRFEQNSANGGGGTWHMEDGHVSVESVVISGSSANMGAAIYATSSRLNASKFLLISGNIAHTMGTLYLVQSSFKFDGRTEFSENYGSLVMFKSNATFMGTTNISNCSEPVRSHDKLDIRDYEGGALTLFKSLVILGESTHLLYNYAANGGAIRAVDSEVYVYGKTIVANNSANKTGGGIYLYHSVLNCQRNYFMKMLGNEAVEKGGGIHAVNSSMNIEAHFSPIRGSSVTAHHSRAVLTFIENRAENGTGGGLYLDVYSKLYVKLPPPYSNNGLRKVINFSRNLARYGGALYESHSSDTSVLCLSPKFRFDSKAKECPIQTIKVHGTSSTNSICSGSTSKNIFFYNNSASASGSNLYSELQGRCNISFYNEPQCASPRSVLGTDYIKRISNIKNKEIGSKPARLCFCKQGRQDCIHSHNPGPIGVSNGTKFSVEVVAVDHVGHPVDAIVHTSLLRIGGYLGDGQEEQSIHRRCTKFVYNVFSPNDNEVLNMHIENSNVKTTLIIQFTACDSCPIGFNKTVDERNVCKCDCDPKLKPYIKTCNASREVITREGEFWITYINTTDITTSGYLIYPFCPYNYCLPPTSTVEINLNLADGPDTQCADGRSGLLCGQCRTGLSLSLGSSRCIPCSNKWPITLTIMLIAGLVAGVVLVVLLMFINLTVAVGTLNSIIFYANIVQANSSIFLPFSKPNPATIFISFLNLDIGFDTCFFEGFDAYWKTLFHLAIPFYVIFLVIVIIFTTEHSTRFAKLLARRNPVATLATLVLLSYSKQLQTIIASLSFATLEYPDGSHRTVWLPDASVEYLKGKHIVLFAIAVLILLVGGFYTILLFTWQWLLRHQDKVLLRWMKHQKLCHFIEPYHAPYNFSQRYWFGLLLIARIPVYIISAVAKDPRFKLLTTTAVVMCLLLVKLFSLEKQMYRKRLVDILDVTMHMNVIGFAALTWYTFDVHPNQQTCAGIAYLSVTVTLTLLMSVVIYHTLKFTRLSFGVRKAKTSVIKLLSLKKNTRVTTNRPYGVLDDDISDTMAIVTYSTVELTECTTEDDPPISRGSNHNDCSEVDVQSHSTSNNSELCTLTLESTLSE